MVIWRRVSQHLQRRQISWECLPYPLVLPYSISYIAPNLSDSEIWLHFDAAILHVEDRYWSFEMRGSWQTTSLYILFQFRSLNLWCSKKDWTYRNPAEHFKVDVAEGGWNVLRTPLLETQTDLPSYRLPYWDGPQPCVRWSESYFPLECPKNWQVTDIQPGSNLLGDPFSRVLQPWKWEKCIFPRTSIYLTTREQSWGWPSKCCGKRSIQAATARQTLVLTFPSLVS